MDKPVLCVVGLGYVGLPLAHIFAENGYEIFGYDTNEERIGELKHGHDSTGELSDSKLAGVRMQLSNDPACIGKADIVILALPTPVDEQKKPDITILKKATKTVGEFLKRGAIVVYESTVYPGTTEEICRPILEEASGLTAGKDFFLGYSPERINPGDREHTVEKIVKVVAGQDARTADTLVALYGSVISAGVHRAPNIKVAEMAKAIENAQRDLNIAFVNEVALLCHKLDITTSDVLAAAGTKWNFLREFHPGLVGGHCIGVDPYYLVEKARQLGMETQVIAAGRAINDRMSDVVADELVAAMGGSRGKRVLVMGLTFKPDVRDTRNSKSFDVAAALKKHGCAVEVHDPYTSVKEKYTQGSLQSGPYDGIALLVPHRKYRDLKTTAFVDAMKKAGAIYDLKSVLDRQAIEGAGMVYRAL